ncbi:MAG TPA: hypothetical protein VKA75_08145, partial [Reyranella sp.]|nr:hypothetical protein [Reyranella sp.]
SSARVWRRTIRAETTKIEAYNDFLDWVSFGGPVIKSGDPVEQEKRHRQLKPFETLPLKLLVVWSRANLLGISKLPRLRAG